MVPKKLYFFVSDCVYLLNHVHNKMVSRLKHILHSHRSWCQDRSTTPYIKAWGLKEFEWMNLLYGFLHGINWTIFHGLLNFVTNPPKRVRSTTKPIDHGTSRSHHSWFSMGFKLMCHFDSIEFIMKHCSNIKCQYILNYMFGRLEIGSA